MTPPREIKKDLVFEIGTEELPATNLADIFSTEGGSAALSGGESDNNLLVKWKNMFRDNRL